MSRIPALSAHPDALVVQLEICACTLVGVRTLLGLRLAACPTKTAKPNGLLHREKRMLVGPFNPRLVMCWYWRDAESLDAWARDARHAHWWVRLVTNAAGTSIRIQTDFVRRRNRLATSATSEMAPTLISARSVAVPF